MIKVSAVMPVYNSEKYLDETMKCLINQSLKEIEIICVNDASTDGTQEKLENYAKSDPRIKIFNNNRNFGPGYSRNFALSYAKGDYIFFPDSDDLFEKDMLKIAYEECVKYDLDVGIVNADCFDNITGNVIRNYRVPCVMPTGVFNHKNVNKYMYTMCYGWAWDKLFKREFVRKNNFTFGNLKVGEDMCFTYIALSKADRIKYVSSMRELYHYRKNISDSLTLNAEKNLDHPYQALQKIKSELNDRKLYSEFEYEFINLCVSYLVITLSRLKNEARREFYENIKNIYTDTLGIDKYSEDVFNNKYYYRKYKLICNNCFSEELYKEHLIGFNIDDLYIANADNINALFGYFEKNNLNVAIWDEDQNGFSSKFKKFCKKNHLQFVELEHADIVIVSNSSWFEKAKNMIDNKIFDLDAYLKFSPKIEKCINS